MLVRHASAKLPQDIAQHSRLVVAGGDWADESSVGDLIGSSPHGGRISFQPQFVPDDMIPEYSPAADVVVLRYPGTSGSGAAGTAMTSGKPVVSSALDTMRECLTDYKEAAFVPAGDSMAIAQKLVEVYAQYRSGKVMVHAAGEHLR